MLHVVHQSSHSGMCLVWTSLSVHWFLSVILTVFKEVYGLWSAPGGWNWQCSIDASFQTWELGGQGFGVAWLHHHVPIHTPVLVSLETKVGDWSLQADQNHHSELSGLTVWCFFVVFTFNILAEKYSSIYFEDQNVMIIRAEFSCWLVKVSSGGAVTGYSKIYTLMR